jgi:acetyl-CoA synthetase
MSEIKTYPAPAEFAAQANVNAEQYESMYRQSVEDPEGFWSEQAENYISWFKPWNSVSDWSFGEDDLHIKWFEGAELNVSYNCLDRHLEQRADQTAIIWEGDDPGEDRRITYAELHQEVCKFANVLKSRGVSKGDRVSIYMPMIPEAAVAMLACTRIGAVHYARRQARSAKG